jgi:Ca2+-binding EF-hand superfamily protein
MVEFKETFALFDRSGQGKIPVNSLGDLLRACGQNPTEKQVAELIASANTVDGKKIKHILVFV